jgi:hypothetical protein
MSEDVRVAAAASAGSRHTGPLTSIYMEMDRIQMRADFATSQWDETLLKSKDAEQEVKHTYFWGARMLRGPRGLVRPSHKPFLNCPLMRGSLTRWPRAESLWWGGWTAMRAWGSGRCRSLPTSETG